MRVFTGEPGSEHRETLESASRAAAAGGVTTMVDAGSRGARNIDSIIQIAEQAPNRMRLLLSVTERTRALMPDELPALTESVWGAKT